jgi:multidrug efflux pump subunit AcrA (membrane-fusion protein)
MSARVDPASDVASGPRLFASPLMAGLYRSSRPGVAADTFRQGFLGELRNLLNATAIAMWGVPEGGPPQLRHGLGLPTGDPRRQLTDGEAHRALLTWASAQEEPRCVEPDWSQDGMGNPTHDRLLVSAATVAGKNCLVLEVFRPDEVRRGEAELADELRFLAQAAQFAADYARAGRTAARTQKLTKGQWRPRFAGQIHSSLDPVQVAYHAANDGARVLGVDAVSVLLRRRGRAVLTAVTGQPEINRRANQVKLIEAFGRKVIETGQSVAYRTGYQSCPGVAEGTLKAYVAASQAKVLLAIPLPDRNKDRGPLGVLVVEQFAGARPRQGLTEDVTFVSRQTARSLQNACQHEQIFLRPLRSRLGRMAADSVRARRIAWMLALAAVTAALVFVRYELKLPGAGILRAQQRRGVFAAEGGTVRQLPVSHGERVHAGQTVAVLENSDLSVEHHQALEEQSAVRESLKLKAAERGERGLSSLRQVQLDGEIAELTERAVMLERRVELLQGRLAQLTLAAPMDGTVVTWDPQQQLLNRPVNTGSLLLQIIEEGGPWRLELEVDDADSGYVAAAWNARPQGAPGVPVEYILATHPERRHRGWMVELAPRTENRDGRHLVYVTVHLDPDDLPPLRDGAEVRAKVLCGERRLGFVVFRQVIEFVQSRVMFLF